MSIFLYKRLYKDFQPLKCEDIPKVNAMDTWTELGILGQMKGPVGSTETRSNLLLLFVPVSWWQNRILQMPSSFVQTMNDPKLKVELKQAADMLELYQKSSYNLDESVYSSDSIFFHY